MRHDPKCDVAQLRAARRRRLAALWCALALFGAALEIAIAVRAARNGWFGDFPHYYVAARRVAEGRTPYGMLSPAELTALALDARHYPTYRNYPADPPPTIALLAPLAQLPLGAAWTVLTATSAASLFAALYVAARCAGFARPLAVAIAGTGFATIPGRGLLWWGHMESFVVLAIALGWRALRAGRSATGAAWWTLAASLKAFPALLLLPMIVRRDRRAIAGAAAALVAIAGTATAILGTSVWRTFATDVVPRAAIWAETIGNLSVAGLLGSLGASPSAALAATAAVALVGMTWLAARPGNPDRWLIAGTSLSLLLSPLVWVFYYVLVFPALAALASTLDLSRPRSVLAFAALALVVAFWPAYLPIEGARWPAAISASVRPLALAVLFVWGMRVAGADHPPA